MKFSGVTILQGVEFSIFPIDFEWALQRCSATALPVILIQLCIYDGYLRAILINLKKSWWMMNYDDAENKGVAADCHLVAVHSYKHWIQTTTTTTVSRISFQTPNTRSYQLLLLLYLWTSLCHPYLDFKTASTNATSIVRSKLDYCNSLHYYYYSRNCTRSTHNIHIQTHEYKKNINK